MWKAYTYKDASGNDAYVTDYEKYISTGGDAKALTETTTSDYNKAVNEFVGKSAIPDSSVASALMYRSRTSTSRRTSATASAVGAMTASMLA